MIIEWICETGYVNCDHRGEIEVNDNATDKEINALVMDEALNHLDIGWYVKEDKLEE